MEKNKKYTGYIIFATKIIKFILISFILIPQNLLAEEINEKHEIKLHRYIEKGGCIVTKESKNILSYNPDKQFIPASIWKLVTSLAALETLGEKYRFKTEFYLDSHNNLYIKGFGDPFLISEEIDLIFKELLKRRLDQINNIYLDSSSFNVPEKTQGVSSSLNPYDVINGALAVNFNTINFYVDDKGTIRSAEEATPTLPIMKELGRGFKKGRHRINISRSPENILRHTGQLFRAFKNKHMIPGEGSESNKETPDSMTSFYVHYSSKTLSDVIKAMMLYSNNYIANQIYLSMGANKYGYPATWKKAKKYLREYIDQNFKDHSGSIIFDEGSGISRNNRITARAMIEVLEKFKPYGRLLPLEKGRLIKTGTLTGVYSYAGYFMDKNRYDSFVIILNQKENKRYRILELIEEIYKRSH